MNSNNHLDKKSLKAGNVLFRQDEIATTAYLIQTGTINITKVIDGEKIHLADLTVGDIVGERALLENSRHSTSAEVAHGGAVVIAIEKKILRDKYHASDTLIKNIIEALIHRLEQSNDNLKV